jgi:hypothetical protein
MQALAAHGCEATRTALLGLELCLLLTLHSLDASAGLPVERLGRRRVRGADIGQDDLRGHLLLTLDREEGHRCPPAAYRAECSASCGRHYRVSGPKGPTCCCGRVRPVRPAGMVYDYSTVLLGPDVGRYHCGIGARDMHVAVRCTQHSAIHHPPPATTRQRVRLAPRFHGTQSMEQVLTAGSAGAGVAKHGASPRRRALPPNLRRTPLRLALPVSLVVVLAVLRFVLPVILELLPVVLRLARLALGFDALQRQRSVS